MFADFLCDSAWANRSRRGWTALVSFSMQALAVGALLALPLLYNRGLPQLRVMVPDLIAPALPAPSLGRARSTSSTVGTLPLNDGVFVPSSIPVRLAQGDDAITISQVDASGLGMHEGGGDPRVRNGVFGSTGSGINIVAPPPPPVVHQRRVSRMMEGNLVVQVQPVYPAIARQARIQGAVILRAVISREGTIENLQVLSGHPLLAPAALAAVRQWRYRPYSLNGEPVEVETQITVNFVLGG